jgi:tRNA pseudouridine38-40 synthase
MWVSRPLDFESMRQAAAFMVGEHDFAAFCAAHADVKDTVRRVRDIRLEKKGGYITIDVWGNGFLRNMVRIMAGTLIAVGLGDIAAEDVPAIIGLKDRGRSGPTADGCGLYLVEVMYG